MITPVVVAIDGHLSTTFFSETCRFQEYSRVTVCLHQQKASHKHRSSTQKDVKINQAGPDGKRSDRCRSGPGFGTSITSGRSACTYSIIQVSLVLMTVFSF